MVVDRTPAIWAGPDPSYPARLTGTAEPIARRTSAERARRDRERISLGVSSTAEKSESERCCAEESRTNTAYFHEILDGIENEPLRWSGLLVHDGRGASIRLLSVSTYG